MSFLLAVVAFVWLYKLGTRIDALEKRMKTSQKIGDEPRTMTAVERAALNASFPQTGVNSTPPPPPPDTSNVPYTPVTQESHEEGSDSVSRFIAWVQKDFMMKVGAFLLLCALGWFVSYAFMNNWIGEVGRITLGLLLGTAFLGVAVWRIQTHAHQGAIFAVLGSSTVLLTTFAAREIYDFFTPLSALLLMFASIVFVAFLSVRYERKSLAVAGLMLSALAPEFTSAPASDVLMLFSYLTVVVLGTLWIVRYRGWSVLTLISLGIVFVYGAPYMTNSLFGGDRDIALSFGFFFTAVFFGANLLGLIRMKEGNKNLIDIVTAVAVGVYLISWVGSSVDQEWQSLMYTLWMLIFTLGGFVAYRFVSDRNPFYVYGAISLLLLAIATEAELKGTALTIAYVFEIMVLSLLTLRLLKNVRLASILALLFGVPVLLSSENIFSSAWLRGAIHEDFFVLTILMGVLAYVGYEIVRASEKMSESHAVGKLLMVVSALYGLLLIWLVLHVPTVLPDEAGTMLTLIIYTVIGLSVHIRGTRSGRSELRLGGALLLGFVVLRLLTVDVWQMELTGKIITFAAIGALLIGTAFVRKTALPKNREEQSVSV